MKKHSNVSEIFGSYIRRLRIKNNIGQRELSKNEVEILQSSVFQNFGKI